MNMKKIIQAIIFSVIAPAFVYANATTVPSTTIVIDQTPTTSSSTDIIDILIEEEQSTTTATSTVQEVEDKLEIATKIVIKLEQVIPVFEAYLKRIEIINEKISVKGSDFKEDSLFYASFSKSESLRLDAVQKVSEIKTTLGQINDMNLDESLVLIRAMISSVRGGIFESKQNSKDAIDHLRDELTK